MDSASAAPQWVRFGEFTGDQWIIPIWHAAHLYEAAMEKELPQSAKDLGVHVAARINLVPFAWAHADEEAQRLVALVAKAIHDEMGLTRDDEPTIRIIYFPSIPLPAHSIYSTVLALHSAIYETNACLELLLRLVAAFCKAVGLEEKPTRHELLKHVADARGDDASWVNDLRVARDHFLHRATGYLALDWAAQDLLLLTRDVSKFEDPTTYIGYSRLRAIRDGFELSKEPLQVYLMRLLMPEADQGVIDVFREMAGYTVGN